MKTIFFSIFFMLMYCTCSYAQHAIIDITNKNELCAGYSSQSVAQVKVISDHPFRIPDNVGVVYDWYTDHTDGNRRWNTAVSHREVPMPWTGQYAVYVVVRYVNKETLSTYAAFKSNVIRVNINDCPTGLRLPQTATSIKKLSSSNQFRKN